MKQKEEEKPMETAKQEKKQQEQQGEEEEVVWQGSKQSKTKTRMMTLKKTRMKPGQEVQAKQRKREQQQEDEGEEARAQHWEEAQERVQQVVVDLVAADYQELQELMMTMMEGGRVEVEGKPKQKSQQVVLKEEQSRVTPRGKAESLERVREGAPRARRSG